MLQWDSVYRGARGLGSAVVCAIFLLAVSLLAGCSGGSPALGSGTGPGGNDNPVPQISSLSPGTVTAGTGAFTLTVKGAYFVAGSVVSWAGQNRATTFVSSSQLTASVEAADVATAGSFNVVVTNPAPGGGPSVAMALKVSAPLPPLTSRTDWKHLVTTLDAGATNYSDPQFVLFDPVHNQVFVSIASFNVVEVFDAQTHAQKATIYVSSPMGMDISPDGSTVYLGTGTTNLYVLDPVTLHVREILNSADVLPGGFSSASVFLLSDGRLFILPGYGLDGDGPPVLWSLANGTAQTLTPPVDGAAMRTGDHKSVVLASQGTGGDVAVFSAATNQFITTPYVSGDIVERVAANPVKDQFAVSDLGGNISVYDSQLNLLGSIRIEPAGQNGGQRLNGMVFSGDGARLHLFVDDTIQEYDTAAFQQQAVMVQPYAVGVFNEPLPFAEDSSGQIFAVNDEGLDFIDVSAIQSDGVTSLPYGYGYNLAYLNVTTGPLGGGTTVSNGVGLAGTESGTVTAAYMGTTPVWDLSASGNQFSFEVPPATAPGPANMELLLSDQTLLFAPLAFSYGPNVAELVTTGSGADGGGTGFIAGYGFGSSTSGLQITVGGQAATVTGTSQIFPDLNMPYPAPLSNASFTIPKGAAGLANVVVTTASGSQTLPGAFEYKGATTLHASGAAMQQGVYDHVHNAIYFTAGSQILTWSIAQSQWLTAITVPKSATAQLIGISISPNAQLVAAADQGNTAVVVWNPDTPQAIQSFPVSDGGFNLVPISVAATDQGTVYFNLGFPFIGGWGTRCQSQLVWVLDASTGAATDLDSDPNRQFCMSISDRVLASPDGSTVYLSDEGGLALYDVASGQFDVASAANGQGSDLALSSDGTRLISSYSVLDTDTGYVGTPAWSEIAVSDNQTLQLGEKLDQNGALLLQPWSNALDFVDLSHMAENQRIALPVPSAAGVFDALVWDGDNDTAYVIAKGGLLEIPLTPMPLVLLASNPGSGGAGTAVTLTGSGFAAGMTASVSGVATQVTVVDEHSATITIPALAKGASVITLTAANGRSSFLDPGFMYGATQGQARSGRRGSASLKIPSPGSLASHRRTTPQQTPERLNRSARSESISPTKPRQ